MLEFLTFLIGYMLSQFYRSFLAVIAPELSIELHLTPADLGHMSAAWFATFAAAQIPVGVAFHRFGPRRTLAVLALAGVAGALVFARAHTPYDAMIAMALIGIGCSGALMGPLFVFARAHDIQRFGLLSSLIIGLGGLGSLIGGTPLALMAQSFGWRMVFNGLAVITVVQIAFVLVGVRNLPRDEEQHSDDGGLIQALRDVLSIRSLWPLWPIMAVGYGILITERGLWVGPYLSDTYGLSPVPRGNVIFIFDAAISLGALAYGSLETWLKTRKPLALTGSLVAGLALGALAMVKSLPLTACAILLCVFGFAGMNYGPIMAHIRLSLPDRLLSRGMAFANFLCMSGAGLLQAWSGAYVTNLKAKGLSAADVFSSLHMAYAAVLIGAALIYAFAVERIAARRPGTDQAGERA